MWTVHTQTLPILPVLDFAQRAGNLVAAWFGALGLKFRRDRDLGASENRGP